jgi:hypothetical protein
MKKQLENPNDHKVKTPSTKGKENQPGAFTSYDTTQPETATPQKVREARESTSQQKRRQHSRDEESE